MTISPTTSQTRVWGDLMELAEITTPNRPWTRRAFSPLFLEGREFLQRKFEAAGLECRLDAAGNLIGRLAGSTPELDTIVIGSHSDTVDDGGRFDGPAGVIVGLEIARSIAASGRPLRHNLEVIDFLAEEPSPYGLSCVGSRGMSGHLNAGHLDLQNEAGERLEAAIDRIGGDTSRLSYAIRDDIAASFELHIEQGPVLERGGYDVGIVTNIVGIIRLKITFSGAADHAGTTPMSMRRDSSVAMAATITAIREIATELADRNSGHFVATTGIVLTEPNAANVVPRQSTLVSDIRFEDRVLANEFLERIDRQTMTAAAFARVTRSGFEALSDSPPTACSGELQTLLAESADRLGYRRVSLASGAGHDTAFMAKIAPAAMIFVPCKDGRSHTPEEWVEPEELAKGTECLYHAIRAFDATSLE